MPETADAAARRVDSRACPRPGLPSLPAPPLHLATGPRVVAAPQSSLATTARITVFTTLCALGCQRRRCLCPSRAECAAGANTRSGHGKRHGWGGAAGGESQQRKDAVTDCVATGTASATRSTANPAAGRLEPRLAPFPRVPKLPGTPAPCEDARNQQGASRRQARCPGHVHKESHRRTETPRRAVAGHEKEKSTPRGGCARGTKPREQRAHAP